MQHWDVPGWVDAKLNVIDEEAELLLLGEKRKRKDVNYRDELSDNRYLQIVDAGGDPEAERERIRKRRKAGMGSEESDYQSDLVVEEEPQVAVNPEALIPEEETKKEDQV